MIGSKIKYLRYKKKFTQENLASKSGLSDRFIRSIENGDANYSLLTLNKIIKALDLNIYNFFNNKEGFPMKQNEKLIFDNVLEFCSGDHAKAKYLIDNSLLLGYIERKTRAINRTNDTASKSRFSFANLYAIYVVTENFIAVKNRNLNYSTYEGMAFTAALERVRSLPYGSKLQNHALNHRCNEEFKKYFSNQDLVPIIRDVEKGKYWVESKLLYISYGKEVIDISELIISIIDEYVETISKQLNGLLDTIKYIDEQFKLTSNEKVVIDFIKTLLKPTTDARTFELVAFVILKYYYRTQKMYFGLTADTINEVTPELYKTGRTNANDGGVDYILQPLGKIYQVTEVLDFKKYFLDIGKLNHYKITFVIKTTENKNTVMNKIVQDAIAMFPNEAIANLYLSCFDEIITINELIDSLNVVIKSGYIPDLLNELVQQTQLEFNMINNDL